MSEIGKEKRNRQKLHTELHSNGKSKKGSGKSIGRRKKSRRRSRKMKRLLRAFAAALIVLMVGAVIIGGALYVLREKDSMRLTENVYMGSHGAQVVWNAGSQLIRQEDKTLIKAKGETREFEHYPLIGLTSGDIYLQKSMLWTQIAEDKVMRMDYFGKISQTEGGITLSRGTNQVTGVDGFLFDCADTYIFLQEAELTWNGDRQMTVSPMTVVITDYMGQIEIYGPDTEPIFSVLTEEDVEASFGNGKKINLATDQFFMQNGTWRLLFMALDRLNPIGG